MKHKKYILCVNKNRNTFFLFQQTSYFFKDYRSKHVSIIFSVVNIMQYILACEIFSQVEMW